MTESWNYRTLVDPKRPGRPQLGRHENPDPRGPAPRPRRPRGATRASGGGASRIISDSSMNEAQCRTIGPRGRAAGGAEGAA